MEGSGAVNPSLVFRCWYHGFEPTGIHPGISEPLTHFFGPTFAKLLIVGFTPNRIGVAMDLDRNVKTSPVCFRKAQKLLHLGHRSNQERLLTWGQLDAASAELELDGFDCFGLFDQRVI